MNTFETNMPTTTFTARIDTELKSRLEQIAQYEDRSASYLATRAIQALVEEREATHGLIDTGLALVKAEAGSIPAEAVDTWLDDPADTRFPRTPHPLA